MCLDVVTADLGPGHACLDVDAGVLVLAPGLTDHERGELARRALAGAGAEQPAGDGSGCVCLCGLDLDVARYPQGDGLPPPAFIAAIRSPGGGYQPVDVTLDDGREWTVMVHRRGVADPEREAFDWRELRRKLVGDADG